MHRPWFLFALLIVIGFLTLALFFIEEVGEPGPHPKFSTMQQGGDGADRHGHVFWIGAAMGVLMVVFPVACLALGMSRGGKAGPAWWPLLLGATMFALIFAAIFVSYREYMFAGSGSLVWGLPVPSAWVVYGVWAFPLFFVVVFLFYFDRWFVRPADLERLRQFVAEERKKT
ncbi:MAG: hypothetical protein GY953_26355 [bacterium]|nr:hypothetical protein [bacterium]